MKINFEPSVSSVEGEDSFLLDKSIATLSEPTNTS